MKNKILIILSLFSYFIVIDAQPTGPLPKYRLTGGIENKLGTALNLCDSFDPQPKTQVSKWPAEGDFQTTEWDVSGVYYKHNFQGNFTIWTAGGCTEQNRACKITFEFLHDEGGLFKANVQSFQPNKIKCNAIIQQPGYLKIILVPVV